MKSKYFKKLFFFYWYWSVRNARNIEEAWKKTFEKWDLIIDGFETHSRGIYTCGLCNLFNNKLIDEENECNGCPIYLFTKKKYCKRTPYADWYADRKKENAQAEKAFLKRVYRWWKKKYGK